MDIKTLHRAALGVCNLSDLFSDVALFRHIVTPKNGSFIDKPTGYSFVSGINSVPTIDKVWWAMCGKPTPHALNVGNKFMCAGPVDSFCVIPWPDEGLALVTCTDQTLIPSCWLAFIPLDQVPDGLLVPKKPDWRASPCPTKYTPTQPATA